MLVPSILRKRHPPAEVDAFCLALLPLPIAEPRCLSAGAERQSRYFADSPGACLSDGRLNPKRTETTRAAMTLTAVTICSVPPVMPAS